MIDLKKAFDGICQKTLLRNLYTPIYTSYGIRGKVINWFKSYLTISQIELSMCKQCIMVLRSKSETKTITHGVPQANAYLRGGWGSGGSSLSVLYVRRFLKCEGKETGRKKIEN